MAIFLSVAMIEEVAAELLQEYPPETPVAVVEKASWEEERLLSGQLQDLVAMTKALCENFPYVRVFKSLDGWGLHFLASKQLIPRRTPSQLAALLPGRAAVDLIEWGPFDSPGKQFAQILSQEGTARDIIELAPNAPVLTDDRPLNEYFILRKMFSRIE